MSKIQKKKNEFLKWMGPILDCLRSIGGSAKPREVSDWIAEKLHIPDEQREETLKSGQERFHNQVAWARQYLVWEGLLDGSRHGVWTLTKKGWDTHLSEEVEIHISPKRKVVNEIFGESAHISGDEASVPPEDVAEEQLLAVLQGLPHGGFERVCQRLLRESGFEKVTVTGKSHDGGIDGVGILQLNPFVSFKVLFQCKRYKGTVSRAEVGDFRNAMIGRADKGIILTTGTFSTEAIREASREGAPPVELVDGEKLVGMFESAKLGLIPRIIYEVDRSFFDQFRENK